MIAFKSVICNHDRKLVLTFFRIDCLYILLNQVTPTIDISVQKRYKLQNMIMVQIFFYFLQ